MAAPPYDGDPPDANDYFGIAPSSFLASGKRLFRISDQRLIDDGEGVDEDGEACWLWLSLAGSSTGSFEAWQRVVRSSV
jgi:hypothetical protein